MMSVHFSFIADAELGFLLGKVRVMMTAQAFCPHRAEEKPTWEEQSLEHELVQKEQGTLAERAWSVVVYQGMLTCRNPEGSSSLITSRQYSIRPVDWRSFRVQ